MSIKINRMESFTRECELQFEKETTYEQMLTHGNVYGSGVLSLESNQCSI